MRSQSEHGHLEAAQSVATPVKVVIPYTDLEMTRRSLASAAALVRGIPSAVRIVAVHVVPFPAPFHCQESVHGFLNEQLTTLTSELDCAAEATVVLAREYEDGYRQALEPGTTVLIAMRRRWWPTREQRLARMLTRLGFEVVTVEA